MSPARSGEGGGGGAVAAGDAANAGDERAGHRIPWWILLLLLGAGLLWMLVRPATQPLGPGAGLPPIIEGARLDGATYRLNIVWTLVAALCVYLMHGGFGFFEAGMTRRESTVTTLTHNVMVLAVTAVVYWAVGFGLMYGDGTTLAGTHGFFPSLLDGTMAGFSGLRERPVPLVVAFAFALSFSDTPATLVAGSGAERLKLSGFMLLTVLISGVLFPLVGRAVWGGGYLSRLSTPFYDSGAATIQLCGGLCALVTCWRLGPRKGRFNPDGSANRMPSSSLPLVFLGVFILWMGFIGFNAGLSMSVSPGIGLIIVNTVLGSLFGAAVALVSVWVQRGKASLRTTLIGMLTAAVAVTSISGAAEPWAAAVTGAVAGALAPPVISLVAWFQLDDPTEYITMNVFGGVLGTLAVGVFSAPAVTRRMGGTPLPAPGLVYGGTAQLVAQLVGLAALLLFLVPVMLVAVELLHRGGLLRISAEEERRSSDEHTHGEQGYEGFAWDTPGHDGHADAAAGAPAAAAGRA